MSLRTLILWTTIIAGLGFVVPFWPLEVVALCLAAFGGVPVLAVGLALVLDLIYGPPLGTLHYLFVPFTLFALLLVMVRTLGLKFFIDRGSHIHL